MAENKAVEYLSKNGYSIVETNFYSRFGEIDIIAKKDNILHFFEVKYSKDYDPLTRITPKKLAKIIKTVDYYMYKKNIDSDYQVDALLVNEKLIEIVENISY
ncbi:YraN family protein [Sulfurospirillum arcachonense]|uniref:YraN family protein n=1 Tax=Sulfurospirillum arcachonense TaxID=57666 RepID=UPI0024811B82|nr:YraN family protein [Sulfurospirillum arcachonense]